uniref:Ubiquitin-like protease family profile domain-containing protein n=1 Tax=Panagrolaimus sp. JU765 TaxID=591449 RepID=A0AC34RT07_9BILA
MLAKKFTGTKVLDNEISEIAHLIGQSSILKTARIVDEKQFTIILRGSYLELDNLPEEENDLNIFFQNLLDNCNIETYEPTGVQQQILDQILQQNGSVSKDDGLHAIMNNEQLSLKYGEIIIDKDDLSSLSNKRWLTDSIIYGYLYLISEFTAENQDLPDAFTFPAQFFTSPEEYGKKFLERQDIDLSEYERLLFPCHVNNSHWTLFIVNFEDESINYFDSLGGEIPEQYQTKLSEFISQTANETNINWNFKTKEKRPKQKNEYDCGVFVCKYAEYYCKNLPKKVDQQDMPEFRNEILRRLCAKKLSD